MKAKVTRIQATSRMAVKIKDNYYTVEYTEERSVPDTEIDLELEKQELFNSVNSTVDAQIQEIVESFVR